MHDWYFFLYCCLEVWYSTIKLVCYPLVTHLCQSTAAFKAWDHNFLLRDYLKITVDDCVQLSPVGDDCSIAIAPRGIMGQLPNEMFPRSLTWTKYFVTRIPLTETCRNGACPRSPTWRKCFIVRASSFHADLSKWDASHVASMHRMFARARATYH